MRPERLIALGVVCLPVASASAQPTLPTLTAVNYAGGFTRPLGFVQDPSRPDVQYVVQQGGRIDVLVNGVVQPTPFLDLTGDIGSTAGERGLLGLAFPPDYAESGRCYVNHTNAAGDTVIARFLRSETDPLQADESSRFNLKFYGRDNIDQPFSNHNGGNIIFGPDGFLYVGMGDGGSAGDPGHRAQNPATLLGKFLRLDVAVDDTDPEGYDVPADNPFADAADGILDEIWSFGWRNPWRWSFDDHGPNATGALIAGDVGQDNWEEIDYEPANTGGVNYGWRNREGAHDYDNSLPPAYLPLTDPIYEYSHALGESITGGYVYRGCAAPPFDGRYFYADFISGRVWSLNVTGGVASDNRQHTPGLFGGFEPIASFGRDAKGELYAVDYGGIVWKIVPVKDPADFNADGTVNTIDFIEFLNAFNDNSLCADFDGNFSLNSLDVLAYLNEFAN